MGSNGDQRDFTWWDGERSIVLRRRGLAGAKAILESQGLERYSLLSTERALAEAPPDLVRGAAHVHHVAHGQVPDAAAALLGAVTEDDIVALGGGRVIDTAKAIAAAGGREVFAIPTTLSGAEMTAIHRLPAGVSGVALMRPQHVLADPELMASAPEPSLRASAINALAHAAEALYTPLANPVAEMAALRGASHLAAALDRDRAERDPYDVALGSLLSAYALDSAGFAFHHVLCQTIARVAGTAHSATYAALLPVTMSWVAPRAPARIEAFAAAIGTEAGSIGGRLRELAGNAPGLGAAGADPAKLEQIVAAALERAELALTPGGPPGESDLRAILEAAW